MARTVLISDSIVHPTTLLDAGWCGAVVYSFASIIRALSVMIILMWMDVERQRKPAHVAERIAEAPRFECDPDDVSRESEDSWIT